MIGKISKEENVSNKKREDNYKDIYLIVNKEDKMHWLDDDNSTSDRNLENN